MAETTEDCFFQVYILAVFSNLDADSGSLAPCSPAVSTDPEVMFISPPTSPLTHLLNQVSNDEPVSPDSTSTLEASDTTPQLKLHQLEACNSSQTRVMRINTSFDPPIPFQPIVAPFSRTALSFNTAPRLLIQSKATNTATILLASKPTAIIRPRINSRLRYGLKH